MIQFLNSRGDRRKSQYVDVNNESPVRLNAVESGDWSEAPSVLTDEEITEIRLAFQRQAEQAIDVATIETTETSRSAAPIQAELTSKIISQPALNPVITAQAAAISETMAVAAEADSLIVETNVIETDAVTAIGHEIVDNFVIEHVLIEDLATVDAGGIDAVASLEREERDTHALSAQAYKDVVLPQAPAYEEHQAGPLTYFQYYLGEGTNGSEGIGEMQAAYVTPTVRQSAIPGGLIGAGVLGATLVSGFVIADTVKTQPFTASKKPSQSSPQSPLMPAAQAKAVPVPKAIPPEAMPPQVRLPEPKSIATASKPVFSAVPMVDRVGAAPLALAMAPTSSEATTASPRSKAAIEMSTSLESVAPVAVTPQQPSTQSAAPIPMEQPSQLSPMVVPVPAVPDPRLSDAVLPQSQNLQGTPLTPAELSRVNPNVPAALVPPAAAEGGSPISERLPVPTTSPAMPETVVPRTSSSGPDSNSVNATEVSTLPSTLGASSFSSTPSSTPLESSASGSSSFSSAPSAIPPELRNVSETVASDPTTVLGSQSSAIQGTRLQSAVPRSQFTLSLNEMVAAPAVASAAAASMPMPTTQQDATRSNTDLSALPPQVQRLLTAPTNRGYLTTPSNQWRSLTQDEANLVARTKELAPFRQQLSQQSYIQAYQLVSQQMDALPSFGFIDYQRKLIILPSL